MLLEKNSQFEERFSEYVAPMVYGHIPITWADAFSVFKSFTNMPMYLAQVDLTGV